MKTRLAILVALAATAGASTGAYAQPNDIIPGNPGAGLGLLGEVPVLFPSEQGAFKGIEVAKQVVESWILQNGCDNVTLDLKVKTDASGSGQVVVDDLPLNVQFIPPSSYEGRRYNITGVPGFVGGLSVPYLAATGTYSIGSEMQELTTEWIMESPNSNETHVINGATYNGDDFRGTIIKDYWRLFAKLPVPGLCDLVPSALAIDDNYFTNACKPVNTVIDYGYQQIQKHGYIAAKWWQQSQAWRQNGVRSGTYWKVARVAPIGDACEITVKLQGNTGVANTANRQGFNQVGVIEVGVDGSPSTGGWYKN